MVSLCKGVCIVVVCENEVTCTFVMELLAIWEVGRAHV